MIKRQFYNPVKKFALFLIAFGSLFLMPDVLLANGVDDIAANPFLKEVADWISKAFATEAIFLGGVLLVTEKLTELLGITKKTNILWISAGVNLLGCGVGVILGKVFGLGFFAEMTLFATIRFFITQTLMSNGSFSWITGFFPNLGVLKSKSTD